MKKKLYNLNPVTTNSIWRKVMSFSLLIVLITSSSLLEAQDKKVLFLGNSYTFYNNLPELFQSISKLGGYEVFVDASTPGGCTLYNPENGHINNPYSLEKIASQNWDYVILQEQSQYPVIDYWKENYFYPGAQALTDLVKENDSCSKTILFMTWGRKNGGMQCNGGYCSIAFTNFEHMTDSMASSYVGAAQAIGSPVSPVGMAWKNAKAEQPDIDLFDGDGSHPSLAGSYLAACTFFVSIFHEPATGIEFYSTLDPEIAKFLQEVATTTVFDNLDLWNIDTTSLTAAFEYGADDQTIEFFNNSTNAENYFWAFGDGETDTVENPVHIYENPGLYSAELTASAGCDTSVVSHFINIVIDGVGEQLTEEKQIRIGSNSNGSNLSIENITLEGNFTMRILDINGKIQHEKKVQLTPGNKLNLSLSSLNRAIYILQLTNEKSVVQEKFYLN